MVPLFSWVTMIFLNSDEGEVDPSLPKKQKTGSEKTVSNRADKAAEKASTPPEGVAAAPNASTKLMKGRVTRSLAAAPAPSSVKGHVSNAMVFLSSFGSP